jgi:hypothetical protein
VQQLSSIWSQSEVLQGENCSPPSTSPRSLSSMAALPPRRQQEPPHEPIGVQLPLVLAEQAKLLRFELQSCLARVEIFLMRAEAAFGRTLLPSMSLCLSYISAPWIMKKHASMVASLLVLGYAHCRSLLYLLHMRARTSLGSSLW